MCLQQQHHVINGSVGHLLIGLVKNVIRGSLQAAERRANRLDILHMNHSADVSFPHCCSPATAQRPVSLSCAASRWVDGHRPPPLRQPVAAVAGSNFSICCGFENGYCAHSGAVRQFQATAMRRTALRTRDARVAASRRRSLRRTGDRLQRASLRRRTCRLQAIVYLKIMLT